MRSLLRLSLAGCAAFFASCAASDPANTADAAVETVSPAPEAVTEPAPAPLLSPRDTARARVAGAEVLVDYGRPSKRGRVIFGELVPWGEVWRTGANEATHFRTERPLTLGGTEVPAGTYTLYTIPTPQGWTLIVNRQTGQWGTRYDPAQDLARIPMKVVPISAPVEQFTIEVVPQGEGGVLRMTWEEQRAEVPFTVR